MYEIDYFDKGYNMAVRHCIEQMKRILRSVPEDWSDDRRVNIICDDIREGIKACESLYVMED